MNAIKDHTPPSPPEQDPQAPGNPTIGVRVLMPEKLAALTCWPGTTHGAAELLCRLLKARIEAAGCPVLAASRSLPFHRSLHLFDLGSADRCAAMEAVAAELLDLRLTEWTQVAWHDEREIIWRLHYPETGRFNMPSEEERAADQARVTELMEAAKRLQRQQNAGSSE